MAPKATEAPRRTALEVMEAERLVPVIAMEDASKAGSLAGALIAGGLRCAEVTFRTAAAEEAIRTMSRSEELLVGAGTVLTVDQADRALAAGAQFIVSPGFSREIVGHCAAHAVAVFPGVATATEIQMALDAGLSTVKFFPAEQLGGIRMLKALAAPFRGVRFIPTGGVSAATLPDYLASPAVLAVGGSWMVAPNLLDREDFSEVTRLAAEAVALVRAAG